MALRILFFLVNKRKAGNAAHKKSLTTLDEAMPGLAVICYIRYSTFFSFCTSFCRSSTMEESLFSDRSAIGKVELI